MGYTHYFTANQIHEPSNEQWEAIKKAAYQTFANHSENLCLSLRRDEIEMEWDACEFDKPAEGASVTDTEIQFNGKGDDGHETFYLSRDQRGFSFCKTAHKPYDAAVVELLRAVKSIAPHWLDLSSDGGDEIFGGQSA